MKDLASLLPILVIAVVFWLVAIRPAQRRAREAAALQSQLSVGDDVMLTSGIFGTIVEADDEQLRLEVAPGVVVRVARGAVASVRAEAEPTDNHQAEER